MAYNLLVAYDLMKPGQAYEGIHKKIKSLGTWQQVQFSAFYLHTALNADEAYVQVRSVMDANDRLLVVDINRIVLSASNDVIAAMNRVWSLAA